MVTLYAVCPNYVCSNRNIRVKKGTVALIGADFVVFAQLESRQTGETYWFNRLSTLLLTHCLDVWNLHPIVYWFLMLLLLSFVVGLVVLFYWGGVLLSQRRCGANVCKSGGCAADQTDVLGQLKCVRVNGQWPN